MLDIFTVIVHTAFQTAEKSSELYETFLVAVQYTLISYVLLAGPTK